jgi:hypothetical protein
MGAKVSWNRLQRLRPSRASKRRKLPSARASAKSQKQRCRARVSDE